MYMCYCSEQFSCVIVLKVFLLAGRFCIYDLCYRESNISELQATISNQSNEIDNLQSQLSQAKLDIDKANKIKPQTNGTSPGKSDISFLQRYTGK